MRYSHDWAAGVSGVLSTRQAALVLLQTLFEIHTIGLTSYISRCSEVNGRRIRPQKLERTFVREF